MYEFFEHTADLGLRIRAADLNTLFVEAAQALFATIVEGLGSVQPLRQHEVRLAGDDLLYLLFDWLNELLYQFDGKHVLFGRFEVHLSPPDEEGGDWKLEGSAWGEPLDRDRHVLSHEVKAITYHALRVEQTTEGWLAEVIIDI